MACNWNLTAPYPHFLANGLEIYQLNKKSQRNMLQLLQFHLRISPSVVSKSNKSIHQSQSSEEGIKHCMRYTTCKPDRAGAISLSKMYGREYKSVKGSMEL